jgi:hypothetical protein
MPYQGRPKQPSLGSNPSRFAGRQPPTPSSAEGFVLRRSAASPRSTISLPIFLSPERPTQVPSTMFSHPGFFCVVAEQDGEVVGSNWSVFKRSVA